MSLAGCLSLPFTGCCPMPNLPSMRPRASSEAFLILFAYLETVALYNSRLPLPDTLPLLPCGAGGFAGASPRPKAGYGCTRHFPAARPGAAWCLVLGKRKPRPEPGLSCDDPLQWLGIADCPPASYTILADPGTRTRCNGYHSTSAGVIVVAVAESVRAALASWVCPRHCLHALNCLRLEHCVLACHPFSSCGLDRIPNISPLPEKEKAPPEAGPIPKFGKRLR